MIEMVKLTADGPKHIDLHHITVPQRGPVLTKPDWTLDEFRTAMHFALIEVEKMGVAVSYVVMGLHTLARVVELDFTYAAHGIGALMGYGLKTLCGRQVILDPTRANYCAVYPSDPSLTLEGHYYVVLL